MNTASKTAVTTLVFMSVAGCGHKTGLVPPPQATAPLATPSAMVYTPPLPQLPPPPMRNVTLANTREAASTHSPAPRRTPHRKPSPAKTAGNDPSQAAEKPGGGTQQTAANPPAEGSPIGQISSTGETVSTQGRRDIERVLASTESGLNNIKHSLNSEEQLTATQIKTFVAKAKQALADNDLDGAQTLATKAKVLLEELTKK